MELVELGDVCEIIAGQSPPSSSYNQEKDGVPFFQGKADFNEKYPSVRYWCNAPKKMSIANDILMSVRAPVGAININNIDACIGRGLAAIRCDGKINLNFLFNFLKSQKKQIENLGTGSTFKAITIKTLKSIKIPLPPLETQKQIAQILDNAAALRDKTRQLLAEYDQLAQSIFLDMFEIYKTDTKYPKSKIKDVCLKIKKIDKSFKKEEIDYVDISSIDNKKNIITNVSIFSFEERPSRAQQILMRGDIVYSTVRPNLKNIAIVNSDGLIGSSGFAVLRCNKLLDKYYLFSLLKSEGFTNLIMSLVSGANYPAIKQTVFMNLEIPIPPIQLQNQFAEEIALIEQQKDLAKQELQESEDLFQALLQKAFKGELV